jgi:hypothetical protein
MLVSKPRNNQSETHSNVEHPFQTNWGKHEPNAPTRHSLFQMFPVWWNFDADTSWCREKKKSFVRKKSFEPIQIAGLRAKAADLWEGNVQNSAIWEGVDALVSPKSTSLRNKSTGCPRAQVTHDKFEWTRRKHHSWCPRSEIGDGVRRTINGWDASIWSHREEAAQLVTAENGSPWKENLTFRILTFVCACGSTLQRSAWKSFFQRGLVVRSTQRQPVMALFLFLCHERWVLSWWVLDSDGGLQDAEGRKRQEGGSRHFSDISSQATWSWRMTQLDSKLSSSHPRQRNRTNVPPSQRSCHFVSFQSLLLCTPLIQQLWLLLLLDGVCISRIVQLPALERTVEMPALSTKFTTSSTQDKRRKVLASSAWTIKVMRWNADEFGQSLLCIDPAELAATSNRSIVDSARPQGVDNFIGFQNMFLIMNLQNPAVEWLAFDQKKAFHA